MQCDVTPTKLLEYCTRVRYLSSFPITSTPIVHHTNNSVQVYIYMLHTENYWRYIQTYVSYLLSCLSYTIIQAMVPVYALYGPGRYVYTVILVYK